MAYIPGAVSQLTFIPSLFKHLIYQGKVRDTYELPGFPGWLLIVASDRISIFDFVLGFTVPRKGECLTGISHFMFHNVIGDIPHHMMQPVSERNRRTITTIMSQYPDIPIGRSMFVHRASVFPVEMIFRAMLGGSVYNAYQKTGLVAGQQLARGIPKWGRLPRPLFTPSTKAVDGHDVNITQEQATELLKPYSHTAVELCRLAYERAFHHAESCGFYLLDSKMEVGLINSFDGESYFGIVDEVFTPDSSRYTSLKEYEYALRQGKDPRSHDKELVRQWGRGVETPFRDEKGMFIKGINNLDPNNREHQHYVGDLKPPTGLVEQTTRTYLDTAALLVGYDLDEYQQRFMHPLER